MLMQQLREFKLRWADYTFLSGGIVCTQANFAAVFVVALPAVAEFAAAIKS